MKKYSGSESESFFIPEAMFTSWIGTLMKSCPVIAPVAQKTKFIFSELKNPADLRLDYDVTLLPPKTAFFPVKQKLVDFDGKKASSPLAPRKQVLLGVHFYDLHAIAMLDQLFAEGHADQNYLAQRAETVIIGSNVQNVSPRAFWGSITKTRSLEGHDGFLAKINGGYVLSILSKKGAELLRSGDLKTASAEQVRAAENLDLDLGAKCPEKIEHGAELVSMKVRGAFLDEELWEDLAKGCFSCGSCNIVCPSCYCFDVQDRWNLDQKSAYRYRTWDACLTEDFAKVSLGGAAGASENFRERRGQRFRHRMMRKMAYLNEKLGGPACVGCGRCASACVPDIADPVRVVQRVMKKGGVGGQKM